MSLPRWVLPLPLLLSLVTLLSAGEGEDTILSEQRGVVPSRHELLPQRPTSQSPGTTMLLEPQFALIRHPFSSRTGWGGGLLGEIRLSPAIPLLEPQRWLLIMTGSSRVQSLSRTIELGESEEGIAEYRALETVLALALVLGYRLGLPKPYGDLIPFLGVSAMDFSSSSLGMSLLGPHVGVHYENENTLARFSLRAKGQYALDLDRHEIPIDLAGTPNHFFSFGLELGYHLCEEARCSLGGAYTLEDLILSTNRSRPTHIVSLAFEQRF